MAAEPMFTLLSLAKKKNHYIHIKVPQGRHKTQKCLSMTTILIRIIFLQFIWIKNINNNHDNKGMLPTIIKQKCAKCLYDVAISI